MRFAIKPAIIFIPLLLAVYAGVLFVPPVQAQESGEIVCIQCHKGLPDKFSQPVTLWRTSIHAANGINCQGCHGGDAKDMANAMSPARGFLGAPKEKAIPGFCGRCHVGVLKDYLASAHGRALGKGGPQCVTCHGNHAVVKASLDLINEQSCSRCHSYERAAAIRAAMEETERMITGIDVRLKEYRDRGVDTDRNEKALFAVRNRFHSMFHEVDTARVNSESGQIRSELQGISTELNRIDLSLQKRKLAGGAVVAVMLVLALLFHLLKKTFD